VKTFLVLHQAPTSAMEQMAKASPKQAKAGMDAWMAWAKQAGSAIVDLGKPLGNATAIAKGSVTRGASRIVGYSILQADSMEAVMKLLQAHPHLHPPGFGIEVLEAIPMPAT
jgi:hypothetical protein